MLRLELNAWMAHAEGDRERSTALLTQAAELEAATPKAPVTPGPTIPADELLGDLFREQGRAADALATYKRALAHYPERFNSLLGAARSARAVEDASAARQYYEQLLRVASGGTRRSVIDEARLASSVARPGPVGSGALKRAPLNKPSGEYRSTA